MNTWYFCYFSAAVLLKLSSLGSALKHCPDRFCSTECEFGFQLDDGGCPLCECNGLTDMSPCQQIAYAAQFRNDQGFFKPSCLTTGEYAPKQCQSSWCACVNNIGKPFTDWQLENETQLMCNCRRDRADSIGYSLIGLTPPRDGFVPVCDQFGYYNRRQCQSKVRPNDACWCVDPVTGRKTEDGNLIDGSQCN